MQWEQGRVPPLGIGVCTTTDHLASVRLVLSAFTTLMRTTTSREEENAPGALKER